MGKNYYSKYSNLTLCSSEFLKIFTLKNWDLSSHITLTLGSTPDYINVLVPGFGCLTAHINKALTSAEQKRKGLSVAELQPQPQILSRVPLPHNGGDLTVRHKRSQQMDVWYALTRMSRFVPV